jgi:hypothetical protein
LSRSSALFSLFVNECERRFQVCVHVSKEDPSPNLASAFEANSSIRFAGALIQLSMCLETIHTLGTIQASPSFHSCYVLTDHT